MRRALLVVLVLLLPLATSQVDPNERLDGAPIEIASPVTAVAIAGDGSGFLLGRDDPCGAPSLEAPCRDNQADGSRVDQDVWFYYNGNGVFDRSDDADPRDGGGGCQAVSSNDCRFHVVDVAMSATGHRMAVAARSNDVDEGVLLLLTPLQGIVQRIQLTDGTGTNGEAINAVAMSPDGAYVAIASTVPQTIDDPEGAIRLYTWGSTATQTWKVDTATPATVVAVADDGHVAAGAGRSVRVDPGGTSHPVTGIDGNVISVAAADDASHYSVAGYDTHWVALFGDVGDSGSSSQHLYSNKMAGDILATAIHPEGHIYAAGDDTGRLRLYANRQILPTASTIIQEVSSLGGPVRDLAWARDGTFLAAAAGQHLRFYAPQVSGLHLGWAADIGAAVNAVAISDDGDVVVAAVGNKVHVFDALRTLDIEGPTRRGVQPGDSAQLAFTFENTGNRRFDVSVGIDAGSWSATASTTDFALNPGASQAVTFTVEVPEDHAVGDVPIKVLHQVAGRPQQQTTVTIDVGQVRSWVLKPLPPLSQAIDPGQTVQFEALVENLGNSADTTDVLYDLEGVGWQASVTPASVQAGPNEEATIKVSLTAPADAQELDEGLLTLRLSADGDAELQMAATVGASFGMEFHLGSPVRTTPGNGNTTTLGVTNIGNAVDSYRISVGALPAGWSVTFPGGGDNHLLGAVPAGVPRTVVATITASDDAQPGSYQIPFNALSLSDSTAAGARNVLVTVEAAPEPSGGEGGGDPEDNGSPGLALTGLLVTLVAVAIATRLRRR